MRNRLVNGGEFRFSSMEYQVAVLDSATRALLQVVTDKRNWPNDARCPLDVLVALYIDATHLLKDLKDGVGTLHECLQNCRQLMST